MSQYQAVASDAIPWRLVGTLVGMLICVLVVAWWMFNYVVYWFNRPRASRYQEDDYEEEEEEEEEPVRPRRPRRKVRKDYYE